MSGSDRARSSYFGAPPFWAVALPAATETSSVPATTTVCAHVVRGLKTEARGPMDAL